jgi:hypothetical protein
MVDGRQILGMRFDVRPWQPVYFSPVRTRSHNPEAVSGGAVWPVGPLQAYLTVVTKRFFFTLGALLVLGDVGSVVFAVSESSAITATAILIALASAFAATAATEFKPVLDKARRYRTDLVTSARPPLPTAENAMASSAAQ